MDARRRTGQQGERQAAEYLRRQGYRIVERNWRHGLGEIDIVASRGSELVFVEVRTVDSSAAPLPEESVGPEKQRRLARLATAYVQRARHSGEWRIDVIAIDRQGLRHFTNAVSLW